MSWLKNVSRIYLRGFLIGIVILVLVAVVEQALTRVVPLFDPLRDEAGNFSASSMFYAIASPLLIGLVAELILKHFKQRKGVRAFTRFDQSLAAGLDGSGRGKYRVAMIPWPSQTVRSMAIIMSAFEDPETGKELCAVFIPKTPDPTGGDLRIIAREDIEVVDWAQRELTQFHITYGTVNPG